MRILALVGTHSLHIHLFLKYKTDLVSATHTAWCVSQYPPTSPQGPNTTPLPGQNSVQVTGSTTVKVQLTTLASLAAEAGTVQTSGLLSDEYNCQQRMGRQSDAFTVSSINGATLVSQCIQASTLTLENNGGHCLQVWNPRAGTLQVSGSRSVEVFLGNKALQLPSVINVALTEWGRVGRGRDATRLLLHFSRLRSMSNGYGSGSVSVRGQLPFQVPEGAFAVIVNGCQVSRIVSCNVRDTTQRNVCRLENMCVDSNAEAIAVLDTMRSAAVCRNIPPVLAG